MESLVSLLELLAHVHDAGHQFASLLDVGLGYFVLGQVDVLVSDIVVEFVLCFVLKHLRKQLSW